jgi:hypothetical protein
MRIFLDKSCRENQNKPFMFQTFFPENRTAYEIMGENIVQPDRPQMAVYKTARARRMSDN